jgi:hypothetical protein
MKNYVTVDVYLDECDDYELIEEVERRGYEIVDGHSNLSKESLKKLATEMLVYHTNGNTKALVDCIKIFIDRARGIKV